MMHPPHSNSLQRDQPPQNDTTTATDSEIPEEMRDEVAAAVSFVTKLVETPDVTAILPRFTQTLTRHLVELYQGHWYLDDPSRGQAYRCIDIGDQRINRTLLNTARECGLTYSQLRLPPELVVWIDPLEVACRFGEGLGSFIPIFMNTNGKKDYYIDHFDFSKLCQPRVVHPIPSGPRPSHDQPANNRVIYNSSDLMEVEVERALPQSASLLTPPTTPPPQSPSVTSPTVSSSQTTTGNTSTSTNPSTVSSSSPPSSTSVYMNKHQHFFRNNNGKVHPPSYLNLNANVVSTSATANSNHYNYIGSTRSSPASPSLLMFPSSPNSNRNSFNNYNIYGGGSANSPNMFGGQGAYGRSPPRAGSLLNGNTNMMNGGSAGGKLSSKWGPYNFPSSNPGGYPPYHSNFYNAPLQRYNNSNNNAVTNNNGNVNNDRNLYINQRGLRA